MEKKISIDEKEICYNLKRYKGQKRINMHIRDDGLLVTASPRVSVREIESVLQKNAVWIVKNLKHHAHLSKVTFDPKVIAHIKKNLLPKIEAKIEFFNYYYKYPFKSVTIRNQRSRWGSCSSNGTLSFNVHLATVSDKLLDYVIVHELCHLKEMNHSDAFWALVARTIPDYKECRKALRKKSLHL